MGKIIRETFWKKQPKGLLIVLMVVFTLVFSIILQIELRNMPFIVSGGS